MPKLVPIKPANLIRLLERIGFVLIRIEGSHHIMKNKISGKVVTIPIHGNKDIGKRMLGLVLESVGITREEYERLRLKK